MHVRSSLWLIRPLPAASLLQGIYDDMSLNFYLVVYEDNGGIICRRVGDSSERISSYGLVFWTSNATFIESPLSLEEKYLYDSHKNIWKFCNSFFFFFREVSCLQLSMCNVVNQWILNYSAEWVLERYLPVHVSLFLCARLIDRTTRNIKFWC